MLESTRITAELLLLAVSGSVVIGLCFVWAMAHVPATWRRFSIISLAIAAGLPLFSHASGWEATWGKFGWLPMIRSGARDWAVDGLLATAWIHSVVGAAGGSLILFAGFRRIAEPLLEAARLDGNAWQVAYRIVLPLMRPAIITAAAWSGLLVVTEMTVADLYSLRTLPDLVYQQFAIEPTVGPAIFVTCCSCLFVVVTAIVWIQASSHLSHSNSKENAEQPAASKKCTAAKLLLFTIVAMILYVPILGLIIKAGWTVTLNETGVEASFSLLQVGRTFADAIPRFSSELKWSGLLAVLVAGIAVPLALICSRFATRGNWQRNAMLIGVGMAAMIPGPVLALLVDYLVTKPWFPFGSMLYNQTLLPTAIAALPRPLAISTAIIYAGRIMTPSSIEEMLILDKPTRWQAFRYVRGPLLLGSIASAILLSILLTIGDLSAPLLVAPPGVQTVSSRLFGLLHSGVRQQEAGLCLVTLAIEGMLAWLALRIGGIKKFD